MNDHYLIRQIIDEAINDFFAANKEACSCDSCRKRIAERLLDKLTLRYNFTKDDLSYARIQSIDIQIKAEALRELTSLLQNNPSLFHE